MRPALLALDWVDALFLHWPVDAAALSSRLPGELTLDTYDGTAWVSIVAFRIAAARLRVLPRILGLPSFGEINVRTYVRGPRVRGIWFFSLDAHSAATVEAARRMLHLPYLRAAIATSWTAVGASYRAQRTDARAPAAAFVAEATFAGDAHAAAPGSLAHWLAERYCFYSVDNRAVVHRGDVAHAPWQLRDATVRIETNDLLSAHGITPLRAEPLAAASVGVTTRAWPLCGVDAPAPTPMSC